MSTSALPVLPSFDVALNIVASDFPSAFVPYYCENFDAGQTLMEECVISDNEEDLQENALMGPRLRLAMTHLWDWKTRFFTYHFLHRSLGFRDPPHSRAIFTTRSINLINKFYVKESTLRMIKHLQLKMQTVQTVRATLQILSRSIELAPESDDEDIIHIHLESNSGPVPQAYPSGTASNSRHAHPSGTGSQDFPPQDRHSFYEFQTCVMIQAYIRLSTRLRRIKHCQRRIRDFLLRLGYPSKENIKNNYIKIKTSLRATSSKSNNLPLFGFDVPNPASLGIAPPPHTSIAMNANDLMCFLGAHGLAAYVNSCLQKCKNKIRCSDPSRGCAIVFCCSVPGINRLLLRMAEFYGASRMMELSLINQLMSCARKIQDQAQVHYSNGSGIGVTLEDHT
ncbi:hypothetical protein Fmac_008244 [Flemingia macrophylla]|uniref:Uncharacterized protein n=1 Tax=Flemingia macrophylla TaxID=520843 RepID=A0ABD1MWX8_9FABA